MIQSGRSSSEIASFGDLWAEFLFHLRSNFEPTQTILRTLQKCTNIDRHNTSQLHSSLSGSRCCHLSSTHHRIVQRTTTSRWRDLSARFTLDSGFQNRPSDTRITMSFLPRLSALQPVASSSRTRMLSVALMAQSIPTRMVFSSRQFSTTMAVEKMKTHTGAAKRFKLSGSGTVSRNPFFLIPVKAHIAYDRTELISTVVEKGVSQLALSLPPSDSHSTPTWPPWLHGQGSCCVRRMRRASFSWKWGILTHEFSGEHGSRTEIPNSRGPRSADCKVDNGQHQRRRLVTMLPPQLLASIHVPFS